MTCIKLWRPFCLVGLAFLSGCEGIHPLGNNQSVRGHRITAVARAPSDNLPASPVGMDESQLQALLGPPTVQEDRAPGKVWRYRNGRCTVNLTLYPDVETRVYRALAYEVTSDDDSAEKKRLCMAELESRARSK